MRHSKRSNSSHFPTHSSNKRIKGDSNSSVLSKKNLRNMLGSSGSSSKQKAAAISVDVVLLDGDGDGDDDDYDVHTSPSGSSCQSVSMIIKPDRPYTIGRSNRDSHLIFKDPRVSKQHCQILFDASHKKVYLLNGALLSSTCTCGNNFCVVNEFRDRLLVKGQVIGIPCPNCRWNLRASLNGLFVNGVKLREGLAVELSVGDEVMLVCANRNGICRSQPRVGFAVRRIVFQEEVIIPGCDEFQFEIPILVRPLLSDKAHRRVFALRVSDSESSSSECGEIVGRAKSLSACCKLILRSSDPVSCIQQCIAFHSPVRGSDISKKDNSSSFVPSDNLKFLSSSELQKTVPAFRKQMLPCESLVVKGIRGLGDAVVQSTDIIVACEKVPPSLPKTDHLCPKATCSVTVDNKSSNASTCLDGKNPNHCEAVNQNKCWKKLFPPPGRGFYLNRLETGHQSAFSQQNDVSLPELLHPVDSICRMFIATFTSDIKWFLSYCDIPSHLPVTIACHNTERCWSMDPEKRYCVPFPDFPNLVALYPPFPEAIAFGKDRNRRGVGCHHPKLLVLQREDSLRVIITSANLVAKQWTSITNTIWWQDFPRRSSPDCTSLFNRIQDGVTNNDLKSDFAAQLAGFMATLVTDAPSQAYWIVELTKYEFTGANAYLIASVPGIHSYRSLSATLPAYRSKCSNKFLGSVEASAVGLSHLFRSARDSNGVRLKKLAAYLGKSTEKGSGMSEIILRRDKNVAADANAVSVLVPNPIDFSKGDCVQLGFLPRSVAKWVSPLWDIGFFRFGGYVRPQEALAAAFGENNIKVQLTLHVFQGLNFQDIPKMMEPEHVVAFCSLIASVQRSTGLWRLEEVLHQYKWPEHLESDFIYGCSSIGTSVNAQFLAAFSAAAGKRSQLSFDSQESDPEWGCWSASHELKHPSIRIIFPTIERVKSAYCGILPSKNILCFAEKTWQRLKTADILHDSNPYPSDRVGHPMHVKVARRRFKSKADAGSFGWIYCGSHNMSPAAWGRQVVPSQSQVKGVEKGNPPSASASARLHVCNYELGIILVYPPPPPTPDSSGWYNNNNNSSSGLDDIELPFAMPASKYGPRDRPATKRAMSEALSQAADHVEEKVVVIEEEVPDEDDDDDDDDDDDNDVQVVNYVAEEEEAYADILWSQTKPNPPG